MNDRERRREMWIERTKAPFLPSSALSGTETPTDSRVAYALEYLAAQSGMISEKLDTIIELLSHQEPSNTPD